jgi:hypothetical protein
MRVLPRVKDHGEVLNPQVIHFSLAVDAEEKIPVALLVQHIGERELRYARGGYAIF